jgi:hypothetical protein
MIQAILCSNCFVDQGLRLDSIKIGVDEKGICPNCGTQDGRKLDKKLVQILAHRFFVRGTLHRTEYGGAPVIQFNEFQYQEATINVSEWLEKDVKLIQEAIKIGLFSYGPRLWMIGEVEPLKSLENPSERQGIIERILKEYPARFLHKGEIFYRLRKEPKYPENQIEYDSPPKPTSSYGRLDSEQLSIMYGSQDLEVCIHECRATVDDELFVASLSPTRDLKLLDLTELINEKGTEFESLDIAMHMLFLAGEHSYELSRAIAASACKAGFDGLIYPSYFSLIRTGAPPFETVLGISIRRFPTVAEYVKSQSIPNIALFGRPIEEGIVKVACLNRLVINKVDYDIQFGPVCY